MPASRRAWATTITPRQWASMPSLATTALRPTSRASRPTAPPVASTATTGRLPQGEVPAAEAVAQDGADLAEGGVGGDGGGHGRPHVHARFGAGGTERLQRRRDGRVVPPGPHGVDPGPLRRERAGRQLERRDLDVALSVVEPGVDADHEAAPVLQFLLVGEGPLRQLGVDPGLLSRRHQPAELLDAVDQRPGPVL